LEIARLNELMEKYNFTVEYINVPWGEYLEKFTASTMAGDPFADLTIVAGRWFYPSLVASGFVLDAGSLGVFDFEEEKWSEMALEYGKFNGKQYGFDTGVNPVGSGIYWNKTMFEREGQPNLYELVEKKQWTWDKMLEIAKALTKDTDGDGVIDQWGLGDMDLMWALLAAKGARAVKEEGDHAVFGLTDLNALETLQFWQDLFQVHKVIEMPPDGAPWDYHCQQFIDGKSGMLCYALWWAGTANDNMQDDYGFVPNPLAPGGLDTYTSTQGEINIHCIPSTVKNPEEIAIFYDEKTEPLPGIDPKRSENDWYESIFRDKESVDYVNMLSDTKALVIDKWINFRPLEEMGWTLFSEIKSGTKAPQVAVEEKAQQAQAILDDAFKK